MHYENSERNDDPRPLELCEHDYAVLSGSEPRPHWTPNPYRPPEWFRPEFSDDHVVAPELD